MDRGVRNRKIASRWTTAAYAGWLAEMSGMRRLDPSSLSHPALVRCQNYSPRLRAVARFVARGERNGRVALLLFLIAVFGFALVEDFRVMTRWLERPYLLVFPAIGIVAAYLLAASLRRRNDAAPFRLVAVIFAAAFGTLAFSFWPYMIPFSITIEEAAAPHSSLAFMFWGAGLFVFPLMLLYTATNYSVFRGRIRADADQYH